MSSAKTAHPGGSVPPTVARLTADELARIAGEHLTELADHQHRTAVERTATSAPRLRGLGRAVSLGWLSIVETIAHGWHWVWNPRRPVGRLWARLRLLTPSKTFGLWTALLATFVVVMGVLRFVVFDGTAVKEPLSNLFFGGALVGLVVLLWNDLIRRRSSPGGSVVA